jgi:hypothetical protein
MELTDKDIKDIFDNTKKDILLEVSAHLKEKMVEQMEYAAGEKTKKAVNEFFDTEILPEVKKNLLANKQAILEELNKSTATIATEMVKQLTAKAVTNLTGYRGTEILKRLVE